MKANQINAAGVFVDELFRWPHYRDPHTARVGAKHGDMWCHLWCLPGHEEALHEVAQAIGMKSAWFQNKPFHPHYDLVPPRREAAVKLGVRTVMAPNLRRQIATEWKGRAWRIGEVLGAPTAPAGMVFVAVEVGLEGEIIRVNMEPLNDGKRFLD
ncbi:MAG TPA: DUF4031 domain-containing protein [Verrucomicrobiae bacterium]